jgi:glycosyltransferase involved in cell wall biosynthesis
MASSLSILAPTRYPWRFNSPRQSRHRIAVRNFLPLNYISNKIEGITIFNPLPPRRFDLIHAFNRIPISRLPFVIGFESHLPRGFGIEGSGFFRYMTDRIADKRCRAVVATSQFARRTFVKMHESSAHRDILNEKLHVRLPNIRIEEIDDALDGPITETIRVVFVGNHFGRKGGCVTLRMAELAYARRLPILFEVISKFEVGRLSWTDPLKPGYFDRYRKLLELPNVRYHGALPNAAVLAAIRHAHFTVLATFSDTFGYSAIEAMANYTPVIATAQGALPEFIQHGKNGILLDLDTDEIGEWLHRGKDRTTDDFARQHGEEVDRLADAALDAVMGFAANGTEYCALRRNARMTAVALFSADRATSYWDELYERSVNGVVVQDCE